MATAVKFKPVAKDSLFHGQWQYCVGFHLPEVSALKVLDHDYIDHTMVRRIEWVELSKQSWARVSKSHPLISKITRPITPDVIADLHCLADQLMSTTEPFKLVTSADQAWVYTNSTGLITSLTNNAALSQFRFTQAVIARPKNSIKLAKPSHTHRSYLKSCKISEQEKNTLITFLANQADNIRVSPAFAAWLATPFRRSQDYFFIDHTGENWLVLLALVKPGIIRKTMNIIPA